MVVVVSSSDEVVVGSSVVVVVASVVVDSSVAVVAVVSDSVAAVVVVAGVSPPPPPPGILYLVEAITAKIAMTTATAATPMIAFPTVDLKNLPTLFSSSYLSLERMNPDDNVSFCLPF